MLQTQLITSVLVWEHILEVEDERRANHRMEPIANHLAPVQRIRQERKSIFAWFSKPRKVEQPVQRYPNQECCPEA